METQQLTDLLAPAVSASRVPILPVTPLVGDPVAQAAPTYPLKGFALIDDPEAEAALVNYISKEPSLQMFDGKLQQIVHTWSRVTYESLAHWLVWRAREAGAEQAVTDLRRYVSEKHFYCTEVLAIVGIRLENPFALTESMQLAPFDNVPDSRMKLTAQQRYPKPTAALTRRTRLPARHLDNSDYEHPVPADQELQDAALLLTLLGPSCPIVVGAWETADDSTPCCQGEGASFIGSLFEQGPPLTITDESAKDLDEFRSLCSTFLNRAKQERDRLRVPLERLNRAMRHYDIVDKAIDLGISLEALFFGPDSGNEELTFRLKTRAAALLGSDPTDRYRISEVIRVLYRLRSNAVHTGRIENKALNVGQEPRTPSEILAEGQRLIAQALKTAITKTIPGDNGSWDKYIWGIDTPPKRSN